MSNDADFIRGFPEQARQMLGGSGTTKDSKAGEVLPGPRLLPENSSPGGKSKSYYQETKNEQWFYQMVINSSFIEMGIILVSKKIKLFHPELMVIYTF